MNKNHLILLLAGIVLAALIFAKKKKIPEPVKYIRPGDKGNEVYGLQFALSSITGVRLGNMGVYDNETLSAVQYYMEGCSSLADYKNGLIDKQFAADLFQLQTKVKK